ncbi:MAG TPA: hypothetical protein VGA02_13205 [Gemmatimonadales bacterium]|jgi:hypothetical protein
MGQVGSLPVILAVAILAAAWVLLALDVPPVPTWFYVFAWYPTLVLLDAAAFRRDRANSLLARPGAALSLLAWSPVVWLVFEVFNFRLRNWYYVSLPGPLPERWAGIVLSFATVVPAIVLAERALAGSGVFATGRGPTVAVRGWELHAATALGLAATVLVLVWPRGCFPLVWGIGWVLAEPVVYRRAPALSLFRDLERGYWGRVGRLLLGGLGIGLLWESYNHVARGRWIYTVPGLEDLKLFEMPPLGFLGFPVFALEAWAMYGALCALGVAVPAAGGAGRVRRGRAVVAGILAAAFAVGALAGMDHFTVSSTAPQAAELRGLGAEGAELARLRGMGAAHARALVAAGVTRVCDLPGREPGALARALRAARPGPRPTEAEVRVWVRAARRACAGNAQAASAARQWRRRPRLQASSWRVPPLVDSTEPARSVKLASAEGRPRVRPGAPAWGRASGGRGRTRAPGSRA